MYSIEIKNLLKWSKYIYIYQLKRGSCNQNKNIVNLGTRIGHIKLLKILVNKKYLHTHNGDKFSEIQFKSKLSVHIKSNNTLFSTENEYFMDMRKCICNLTTKRAEPSELDLFGNCTTLKTMH